MYADTVDSILMIATVRALVKFGWMTFIAVARRQVLQIVHTTAGEVTTVTT